jgi:hypothetical protein
MRGQSGGAVKASSSGVLPGGGSIVLRRSAAMSRDAG